MSLILEALKKLDREKSSRRGGTVNIAADILKPDLSRPGKRISLYYLVVASLTAVVTVVITYGIISKSSPPQPVNLPAPSQQIPSVPPSREPVQDTRKEPGGLSPKIQPSGEVKKPAEVKKPDEMKKPLEIKKPVEMEKPVEMKKPVEVKVPEEVRKPTEVIIPAESKTAIEDESPWLPLEEKSSQDVVSKQPAVAPENLGKPVEQTPTMSSTTPSSLRISAIVWYEEPSKRFAMINGVIATEGSIVEGVKVVEIMPTSVRLSYNNQHFEISISK